MTAPSVSAGTPAGVRSTLGAKNLKVARPVRLTAILMSLSGGQTVRCMSQNLKTVGPRFIQCCCSTVQQVGGLGPLSTPRPAPDRLGSTPAQPASASTPRTFRLPFEGSFLLGFSRSEVNRRGLHAGSKVDVVDVEDEVDVVVEAGIDAVVVVDVDVGTEVVGGRRVVEDELEVEDEVDVEVVVGAIVDDV